MNILLVYKEADIATYKMLEGLSKLEDFNIYIASPQSYTDKKIYGNCTPLDLPVNVAGIFAKKPALAITLFFVFSSRPPRLR